MKRKLSDVITNYANTTQMHNMVAIARNYAKKKINTKEGLLTKY